MHQVGIENLFDAVADGTNVSKAKPDPEVFLKGAELLNLSPADCVVFEDARAGIEAAHRAGMKCVGIGDSVTLREADTVVGGFLDLSIEKGKLKIINNGEILNF